MLTEQDYLEGGKRTLSIEEDKLGHMIIGLSTEAGELLDAYKKHKFYKRELDVVNIKEEIGDLCWYLYQLADEIGYTIDQARKDNIKKLRLRYPDGFRDIVNRDQDVELKHLS